MPGVLLLAALFLAPAGASAQALPDLRHQDAWTEEDKKAFVNYIESGKTAPVKGSVRLSEAQEAMEQEENPRLHRARYAALSLQNTMLFTNSGSRVSEQSDDFGLRLLAGKHLFSWVRAYAGLEYGGYSQDKLSGGRARLSHLRLPAGLELALIPLGTPHTRYVLLRGGASLHRIWGGASDSDFSNSLLGWEGSWDLGLGYEWQIANTPWRWHLLAEGQKAWSGRFYGASFSAGIARTF